MIGQCFSFLFGSCVQEINNLKELYSLLSFHKCINQYLLVLFQVCIVRFACVINLQFMDEAVGEFYVRLALRILTISIGIFVGLLQFLSGEVTIRTVYAIVTGKVKGIRSSKSDVMIIFDPLPPFLSSTVVHIRDMEKLYFI